MTSWACFGIITLWRFRCPWCLQKAYNNKIMDEFEIVHTRWAMATNSPLDIWHIPDVLACQLWMETRILGHRLRRNQPCTSQIHCLQSKLEHHRLRGYLPPLLFITQIVFGRIWRNDMKRYTNIILYSWVIFIHVIRQHKIVNLNLLMSTYEKGTSDPCFYCFPSSF